MKKTIMAITVALLMLGCSNEAPKCGDNETTDLLNIIVKKKLLETIGKAQADTLKILVENIRTTNVNEKVGSFECAAELKLTGPGGVESHPITYTSELTDDGDSFYVNVSGL